MGAAGTFASGVHDTRDPLYLSFVPHPPTPGAATRLAAVFTLDRHLARLGKRVRLMLEEHAPWIHPRQRGRSTGNGSAFVSLTTVWTLGELRVSGLYVA